jgi:hypothetical protein
VRAGAQNGYNIGFSIFGSLLPKCRSGGKGAGTVGGSGWVGCEECGLGARLRGRRGGRGGDTEFVFFWT